MSPPTCLVTGNLVGCRDNETWFLSATGSLPRLERDTETRGVLNTHSRRKNTYPGRRSMTTVERLKEDDVPYEDDGDPCDEVRRPGKDP